MVPRPTSSDGPVGRCLQTSRAGAACRAEERWARGSALLPVMLVALLASAIALTMSVVVPVEMRIASRFQESMQARYAAEAALSMVVGELRIKAGWSGVVRGDETSGLVVGPFDGARTVPGGGRVLLCCGAGSASARLVADTRASPRPSRRALEWRPYYWGTFDSLVPFDPPSRLFLIVWVANDEEDASQVEDRNDTVLVHAEALEPAGLRRSVEAVIARPSFAAGLPGGEGPASTLPQAVEIVQWREVR